MRRRAMGFFGKPATVWMVVLAAVVGLLWVPWEGCIRKEPAAGPAAPIGAEFDAVKTTAGEAKTAAGEAKTAANNAVSAADAADKTAKAAATKVAEELKDLRNSLTPPPRWNRKPPASFPASRCCAGSSRFPP